MGSFSPLIDAEKLKALTASEIRYINKRNVNYIISMNIRTGACLS